MTFDLAWFLPVSCVVIIINPIAKQLIRERLVAQLIKHRDYEVDIASDWTFSRWGYTTAIKSSAVWGKDGKAMLKIPSLRKLIIAARAASIVDNGCVIIFILGVAWHLIR